MATLDIQGRKVEVSDEFLSLSPDEQADTVDEIAQSLGIQPQQAQPSQQGDDRRPPEAPNIGAKGDQVAGDRVDANLLLPFAQGALLSGADEAGAGLGGLAETGLNLLSGEGPTDLGENVQQTKALLDAKEARTREDFPVASTVAEVGGALATGLVPGAAVVRGASLANKVGRGIAAGTTFGATEGFLSGDGLDDRLGEAGEGAVTGAGIGAVLPVAGAGIGNVTRRIKSFVDTRRALNKSGISSRTASKILRAFDQDLVENGIEQVSDEDLLLNLGPQLRGQAEAIAAQPGRGQSALLNAVNDQAEGASQRTIGAVDQVLGSDAGRVANRTVIEAERKAAGKLFEIAKMHKGRLNVSDVRDELDDLIAEADGPIASSLQRVRGLKIFDDANAGSATATQVHNARMAIDDIVEGIGRDTSAGRNAKRSVQGVRAQVDRRLKQVPGFRKADAAFSSAVKAGDALDEGRKVFQRSFGSPDELAAELKAMSGREKLEFQKGVRDSVSTIMGSARNDALAARNELLNKGWNKEKLQVLLGNDRAAKLENFLEREARFANDRTAITGNSRTAFRTAAQKEFPSDVNGTEVVRELGTKTLPGIGLEAVFKVANALSGGVLGRRRAKTAEEAAQLLSAKGVDLENLVATFDEVSRAKGARLNQREASEIIVNALGVPATGQGGEALNPNRKPLEITIRPPGQSGG